MRTPPRPSAKTVLLHNQGGAEKAPNKSGKKARDKICPRPPFLVLAHKLDCGEIELEHRFHLSTSCDNSRDASSMDGVPLPFGCSLVLWSWKCFNVLLSVRVLLGLSCHLGGMHLAIPSSIASVGPERVALCARKFRSGPHRLAE